MKNTYFDLINQTYYFPQEGFDLQDNFLSFHDLPLKYLIEKHGTPFRLVFLPRISQQIRRAKNLFNRAIKKNKYKGNYYYCYCTKCSHFSHILHKALEEDIHIETSSSFDIDLILKLKRDGIISTDRIIVHNGYKTDSYLEKIFALRKAGFEKSVIVLDSKRELERVTEFAKQAKVVAKIGVRMAIDEEPQSAYYTSRLGIRHTELFDFVEQEILPNEYVELTMMHFFVDSGIKDSLYYWGEFQKAMKLYARIKAIVPTLGALNMGGGFPIRNNLGFEYDYEYMINEIVGNVKEMCDSEGIDHPDLFTEFGKYTVGESGAIIFSVLEQKQQNDTELWYIIDNSLMNTIPDAWSIFEKFILLPVNKWENEYSQVNIGGISCDHSDYYNSEDFNQQVYLPKFEPTDKEPLYVGFFHTGAYQDSISGYGGIKHCLIPSPKQIIVDRDEKGNFVDYVFREEQNVDEMLTILGYK